MFFIFVDIFIEFEDVLFDGFVNFGLLCWFVGEWQVDKGIDINLKVEGLEWWIFIECVSMQLIDLQVNGLQLFYGLCYYIYINMLEEDIIFYDQVGYWLWEFVIGLIMQILVILCGQVLLVLGKVVFDDWVIMVVVRCGDIVYGICLIDFFEQVFCIDFYCCDIIFNDDGSWIYLIWIELFVCGVLFDYCDINMLWLVVLLRFNLFVVIVGYCVIGDGMGNVLV